MSDENAAIQFHELKPTDMNAKDKETFFVLMERTTIYVDTINRRIRADLSRLTNGEIKQMEELVRKYGTKEPT